MEKEKETLLLFTFLYVMLILYCTTLFWPAGEDPVDPVNPEVQ